MTTWIVIAAAVVVVLIAVGIILSATRRHRLRSKFGPEYDRAKNRELRGREKRVDELDILPLTAVARQRYVNQWQSVQGRFVDHPSNCVRDADALVMTVMHERGYPMEDFDQRSADVSVDHPHVVQNYRAAHAISMANEHGKAGTEDLRQAMVHYRTLFEELLGDPSEGAQDRRVS